MTGGFHGGPGPCGPCGPGPGPGPGIFGGYGNWCISIAVFLVILILLFCVFLG